jgi:hypothetical protein
VRSGALATFLFPKRFRVAKAIAAKAATMTIFFMGKSPLVFQVFVSESGLVKERTGPAACLRRKSLKNTWLNCLFGECDSVRDQKVDVITPYAFAPV